MTEDRIPHEVATWTQYAAQAEGDAGNYWQRDDGEVEVYEVGRGHPDFHPFLKGQTGFVAARTHRFGRRYRDEHIGRYDTLEEATMAADKAVPHA